MWERINPLPRLIEPSKLADLFINVRFHRYPVLDSGRVVGVISHRDVTRAMGKHYPL